MGVDRRTFIGASMALAATRLDARTIGASSLVTLENARLRIDFDRARGTILGIIDKQSGWRVRGQRDAAALRLHVPLPERRAHFLTEADAKRVRVEPSADGTAVRLTWSAFESPIAGALPITVAATARLVAAGLEFVVETDNPSAHPVESIAYPILPHVPAPPEAQKLELWGMDYSQANRASLWPDFTANAGYWGVDYPTFVRTRVDSGFGFLTDGDRHALYIGYHDRDRTQVLQFWAELRPGMVDSYLGLASEGAPGEPDTWLQFQLNRLCFLASGGRDVSKAIVVAFLEGDPISWLAPYRAWRATWFTRGVMPSWASGIHAWQQLQINSAEDRLAFRYKELPRYADACRKAGVKVIQLTGWHRLGQDRGGPSHDTDPRLGTAEELREAIRQSRAMGVEVVLFNKYTWNDVNGPQYQQYRRFAAVDQNGQRYRAAYYNYDTPSQLAGTNTPTFEVMCTACAPWREAAALEFDKSVALGASGVLFDEVQHHGPALLCFANDHGHAVPTTVFSGDLALIETFRQRVDTAQFLFAGESPYDAELQSWNFSYLRIKDGHVPLQRMIDPFVPMCVAATGYHDRQIVNRALMYRYLLSYEPRNFHGTLDQMPQTLAYGQMADAFRQRYAAVLWESEYRHREGATVSEPAGSVKGTAAGDALDYSVFRHPQTARLGVAVITPGADPVNGVTVAIDGEGALAVATPERPDPVTLAGPLTLPPLSIALVMPA